jgi:hypothetical protein
MSIYDKLLEKATGKISGNEFNEYTSKHKITGDISNFDFNNDLRKLRFTDFE